MKHSLYIMPLATVLAVLTIGQAGVESIGDKPIVENPKVVVAEQVEITTDEKEKSISKKQNIFTLKIVTTGKIFC